MILCRTIQELRGALGSTATGFVPTMGAFHEGHLALMKAAKAMEGHCTVSSFVNPAQFAPHEDLSRYPRRVEADLQEAEEAGVDIFFMPSPEDVYPSRFFSLNPGPLADLYEGAARPGHFAGVSLVVLKLFNMVQPRSAFFGRKDLQQCAVIRLMVKELNLSLNLQFLETVREPSGLAMSSRNAYFSAEDRKAAAAFPAILLRACKSLQVGTQKNKALAQAQSELEAAGFSVDYVDVVDENTLMATDPSNPEARIISAIRFSGVRLLDNMPISRQSLLP